MKIFISFTVTQLKNIQISALEQCFKKYKKHEMLLNENSDIMNIYICFIFTFVKDIP